MRIGDYELGERIHASTSSTVHRARRIADGVEVFIKTPTRPASSVEAVAQLHHELVVCRMFDSPNLIGAIELLETEQGPALVLASVPDCVSLSERVAQAPLTVGEALRVALGLLDALALLHARNVVHKDIKPDNVLVDAALERIVLIDFGLAAIVPRDKGSVAANSKLEGTLAFMPPEQTGRINRPIDYRSDYYALGSTLYWMLAGEPPFGPLREPEELVHAHVASVPQPLDSHPRGREIPPALARIVAKLLSKAAEERYQGAFGLRADLRRCAEELAAGGWPDFAIASVDPTEQLRLPHHLFGRRAQLDRLRQAYDSSAHATQIVALDGPPGSGKTTLARELIAAVEPDTIVATTGFWADADTESLTSIAALLRTLIVEQVGVEPLDRAALEQRLREAIGPNAALLTEFVPELEQLLGPAPALVEVGPGHARARFFDTVGRLVVALLLPGRRYVVFFDDVQWANELGARVLEALCVEPARGVLVVLARRDDVALAADHPAAQLLARVRARGKTVAQLRLEPLSRDEVAALVEQTLAGAPGSRELAELLHQRTRGTPLFVSQLLQSLYVDGTVDIDRASGRWRIDLAAAKRSESRGDVVDYLVARFAELPAATRRLLGIAACFGSSFDLAQLREVAGEPVGEAVLEAAASGFLLTVSSGRSQVGGSWSTPSGATVEYRFAHERLRQIALAAAPAARAELHFAIARSLSNSAHTPEQLSRVADHISLAVELIHDPDEREQCAMICETSGALAKASAAYAVAARQFEAALRLLDGAPAATRLRIALELGESLYMNGQLDAADQAFAQARALVRGRADHIHLLRVREQLALVRDDSERAVAIALEAGALFGLELRRQGPQEWLDGLLAAFLPEFAELTPARLAELPRLRERELVDLLELLSAATYPAYVSGDINLFIALLVASIRVTLDHGLSEVVAQCFVQFGVVFMAGAQDYEGSRRCAALGFATLERFPGSAVAGQVEFVYHGTYQYLLEPLRESVPALADAAAKLRTSGALLPAAYALGGRIFHELLLGVPLAQTSAGIEDAIAFVTSIPDLSQERLTRFYLVAAAAIRDGHPRPDELRPPGFASDDELFAGVTSVVKFLIHTTRAYVALLLGDWRATASSLREAEPLAYTAAGQLAAYCVDVVAVLHGCAIITQLDDAQIDALALKVDAVLERLGRWELSCPSNATPLRCLVGGAWALARGELERAAEAFVVAADAAAHAHMTCLEGMACELAGRALLALGRRRYAIGCLGDALDAFGRWGATPLQRRVRESLRERGALALASSGLSSSRAPGSTSAPGRQLDAASIIKMSQAILEAKQLEEVIDRLLATVTENAGADRCLLLLEDDDGLAIRAERRASGELYLLDTGVRLSSAARLLPQSLLLASARASEAIIVDDARRDLRCARDPYVRAEQVRALLLVPVFTGSRRVGLLYLENHVTPGAFTAAHVQLATTLAAQAAVSIENARLFEALREGEAQWRAVVDGAPDLILVLDRRRQIEFANRLGQGLEPEQLIGELAERFIDADDRPRMVAATDFVFETGVGTSFECGFATPAGPRRFTTRVGPVVRDDEVQRVVMIASDVTEQRRLETELRHSQKMQAIGTLAGGIAHDFNNLLTVIIGACDLCTMFAGDNQPLLAGLAEIDGAATRAASLTRQLLAFSRKQTLQPKRLDLVALVRELSAMLVRLLGEQVELQLELSERPCQVFADPTQLSQVLVNLAVNARDAMPDGGRLRVRVADEADKIVLEVADTGVGMDAELQRQIFEPFFTTKGEGKGTGLGLSTVLGIVEQSGGRISVSSELGEGTRFRIELPIAEHSDADPALAAAALPRGSETILLVEDELALQRLSARMLELQGYRVRVAANGEQALALARECDELALLITDVIMPGVSGPKLAELIRAEHPDVAVLYISGHGADEVSGRGVALEPEQLLQKPFTREAIATRVRAILDRKPDWSPR